MAIDRRVPPVIKDAVDFDFNLPNLNRFDSDQPIFFLNDDSQDVCELSLVFPAGIVHEQAWGVAQSVASLLRNGTSNKSAQTIDELIEYYGASIRVRVNNEYAIVLLHCLSEHLDPLLTLLHELLTDSQFPNNELDIFKRNALKKLEVNLMQCEFVSNQQIDKLLFGEQHPYGRYTTKASIEALNADDLRAFFNTQYASKQPLVFLAGHFENHLLSKIETLFKGRQAFNPYQPCLTPIQTATDYEKTLLNDPKGVQAALRVGKIFPTRHHPDFLGLVVLNTVLGGYFGSRLMTNIREEKGYTYGIYSSIITNQQASAFVIQSEVGREVADAAIKEIYNEIRQLRETLVDEEELLLVKNYILGSLLADLDGPFNIIQRWRSMIINQLTMADFHKQVETFKSITAEDIRILAQKYLDPTSLLELCVV